VPEKSSYETGVPSWVDLTTSDPAAARDFYSGLFGWELVVGPDEMGNYTMAKLKGKDAAGLGGQPAPEGVPSAWTTYFAVADLDATIVRVEAEGGTVLMAPMDVGEAGRMAIAADPTGAVFGLWQAGEHIGAGLVNEPGTVIWNELHTHGLERAVDFYGNVLGHTYEEAPDAPNYRMFKVGGEGVGGMNGLGADAQADVPDHWLTYFAVADTDGAVATVERLGGKVIGPPHDTPYGRMAVATDPQGAVFAVISAPETPSSS
jgi:predicted enzyme related to lactoylglutathione lyase